MKKIILLLSIILLISPSCFAEISKEEAISEFVQGNLSYKEGDYDRAIDKYENIVFQGKTSGSLYYNLANTYFRQGNLGKAILNYERAKRLMPRDGDINFNYKYVRAKANLFEGEIGEGFFSKLMSEHLAFYSMNEMVKIVLFLVFIVAALHLTSLYTQWAKGTARVILVFLALLICVFVSGLYLKYFLEDAQAIVLAKSEVRFEPRESATMHFNVIEGDSLTILKEEEGWVKVQRSDGKLGWLAREFIEEI